MTTLNQTLEALKTVESDLKLFNNLKLAKETTRVYYESRECLEQIVECIVSEPKPMK